MKGFTLLAAAATTAVLATTLSASAASQATDAFVANVRPNVDFLDRSSRLALDKSKGAAVRSFAHSEAMEQTIAANSLVAWTQTSTARGEAVALGEPVSGALAPLAEIAAVPLDVTNGVGDLVTGRSVAVDRPLVVTRMPREAATPGDTLLPAGAQNMSRLQDLGGRQFDALYRSTQLDSLRQLATLYRDYATSGDDPSLRALSVRELPRVNARIVGLRKL